MIKLKKILKILIGTISIIVIIILTLFSLYSIILSPEFILKRVEKNDYYDKAINEINTNIDYQIVNEDIKKAINSVIDKNKVKEDIDLLVNSMFNKENMAIIIEKEIKTELSQNLKIILKDIKYDESSFNELINTVTESYMKDIFPYNEFKQIEKLILPSSLKNIIFISLTIIIIINLLILYFLDFKNHKSSLCRTLLISGSFLTLIYIIIKLEKILKDFYYSNEYFSLLIRDIFIYITNFIGLVGLIILILALFIESIDFINNKKHIKNDKKST